MDKSTFYIPVKETFHRNRIKFNEIKMSHRSQEHPKMQVISTYTSS